MYWRDIVRDVVERANMMYGSLVQSAIKQGKPALAAEVYELATLLPSAATVADLRAQGYALGGLVANRVMLCVRGGQEYLLKPLRDDEAARVRVFEDAVGDALPLLHVTPFELVEMPGGKQYMIMPKYDTSLDAVSYLTPTGVTMLWEHLQEALDALHGEGFVHGDIKPSNICLDEDDTTAILIDLCSVVRVGHPALSTPAYIPRDLRAPSDDRGRIALDWWMVAMSLAEKACGEDGAALEMGNDWSMSMEELQDHLEEFLDPDVWAELQPRLTTDDFW